jgi:O-antigen ligase
MIWLTSVFKNNKIIIASLFLWQLISTGLMATGVWPEWVSWVNFGLLSLYILFSDSFDGLLVTLVSLPFMVVLPNQYIEGLPAWRLVLVWLGMVWFAKKFIIKKDYKLQSIFTWDKYGLFFLLLLLASLVVTKFPVHGLKQIIFLANAGVIYFLIQQIVTTKEQLITLVKYFIGSLAVIVAIGYIQFIATLFSSQYYFWQYWAVFVSKLYYGLDLANVLIYSNSWFSYTGGGQSLRMFSIMPDSHSFGVVAMFLLIFTAITPPILSSSLSLRAEGLLSKEEGSATTSSPLILRGVRGVIVTLSALALILSGTRGIWVAMLVPLVISLFIYWYGYLKEYLKPIIFSMVCVIILFAISPLIEKSISYIRNINQGGSVIDRISSIYDLSESSNVGRLQIWKESLLYAIHHPLGTGYGNFIVSLYDHVPENATLESLANQKNIRYNLPQKFITAHSLYLHLLVELGVLGLSLFIIFWAKFFWEIIKYLKPENQLVNKSFNHLIIASAISILWLLSYGLFDVTLFNDKILIYTFTVLAIAGVSLKVKD